MRISGTGDSIILQGLARTLGAAAGADTGAAPARVLLLDCWKVVISFQINVHRIYLLPTTTYSAWGGERTIAPGPSPPLSSVMDSLLVSVWHLTRSSLPSLLL